jgi:hypothetical protein
MQRLRRQQPGRQQSDFVGSIPGRSSGVTALSNGNYVVWSPSWNGGRGAATWVNGLSGQTLDGVGVITPQNSVVSSRCVATWLETKQSFWHQEELAT